jgi:hypothetical protein
MPNKSMLRKSTVVLALIISSSAFLWGDQKKASAPPPIQPTQQPARASDAVVLAMLDAVTVAEPTSGTPLLEQVAQQPSSVSIIVPGNQPWTATGVNLKQGELFSVTASGGVAFSAGSPPEGPGGDPHDCLTLANGPYGWRAQPFLANNLPCFSLLGRVGERGPIFEIGKGKTLKSQSSGELYLGVNDNFFPDNSGSWTANISVGPGGAATLNLISAPGQELTNDDIIKLVQVKLPDPLIIAKIKSSVCAFDMSPDGVDRLKQAGVSDTVLLAMLGGGAKRMEVTAEARCLGPGDPSYLRGVHGKGTVRVLSGSGTFAGVSGTNKAVRVDPGAALRGIITLRVLNLGPGFAVAPLIETPSWGRHQDSWKMISNLAPGQSTWNAQINERAPAESGIYYIVFAFNLETSGASVASGTNWATGPPVWDDGNDLAQLDSSQIQLAQHFGCVVNRWLLEDGSKMVYVPADVITVIVGGASVEGKAASAPTRAAPTPLAKGGYKVPIQILNEQSQGTPAPFVQQLIVDSSRYAQFEADNLQNIRFFDQMGHVIPSWLESGNSRSATRTTYWLCLASGVPAKGAVTVFMVFAPPTQNVLDGVTTGEAPGLSGEYGQYDNGKQVFTHYANFVGTSLPGGWSRSVTPGSSGTVAINNGVRIWHSGTGGGASFLGSDWLVQANVAEMHVLSEMTNNGQDMVMFCTSSPREDAWVPGSVGFQNGSGLEVENNQSGTPSVLGSAMPNPMLPAVIGLQGNIVFANYEPVIAMAGPICGGRYLASWANTGFDASFSFDWVRLRPEAPGNVMPRTVF